MKLKILFVLILLSSSHLAFAQLGNEGGFSGGGGGGGGGGGAATQPFACNTNNTSCVTQADSGATQRTLLQVDNANNLTVGTTALAGSLNLQTSQSTNIYGGGFAIFTVKSTSVNAISGIAIQSTGGAVPTCSGGSGTCVTVTGSTNNRGQIHLTGGTAVTSITLTFSGAGTFNQAPFCTPASGTAVVAGLTAPTGACASAASCTFGVTSTTAADITYTCL